MTNISFIGAGNVAWHLARGLKNSGYTIGSIWSRHLQNAEALASATEAKTAGKADDFDRNSDIIIVSVQDEVLPGILKDLTPGNRLVLHTSGSLGLEVFGGKCHRCGVLYPFQTLSKQVDLDLAQIPFFIEAPDPADLETIRKIALSLSGSVRISDADSRRLIHIAGVFACNFTNHLYRIAHDLLEQNSISFDVIKPLIGETARKATENNPRDIQTGPARRGDYSVLEKHLEVLEQYPEYYNLYKILSNQILESYEQKTNL